MNATESGHHTVHGMQQQHGNNNNATTTRASQSARYRVQNAKTTAHAPKSEIHKGLHKTQ